MPLRLDPRMKISDLVSAGSVCLAAVTFSITQCHDQRAQDREYADSVRGAALGQIESLNRIKNRTGEVFESAQVITSRADELLVSSGEPSAASARLYQAIDSIRFAVTAASRSEARGVSFVPLYGYSPCLIAMYDAALGQLRKQQDVSLHELVDSATAIASRQEANASGEFVPGRLTSELRNEIRRGNSRFNHAADALMQPLSTLLGPLVTASDEAILNRHVGVASSSDCEK